MPKQPELNLPTSGVELTDRFSDFIVYVDESGDHSLQSINPEFPVFVLAFCVFYKSHYSRVVVPALQELKFDYFGHDLVILHEHEIRKEKGDFNVFANRQQKNGFLNRLTRIIDDSNFILISCVIDKYRLKETHSEGNAYHIALGYCLEQLYRLVAEKSQQSLETHVVVEMRGKKEDAELELEFLRICHGENRFHHNLPFKLRMASKATNSAGLQLADLVARPIGRHVIDSEQNNRAFDVLKKKFFCEGGRECVGNDYEDWGLKRFPEP